MKKTSGIQVIIWASLSTSSAIEFDQEEFKPIYAGLTDKDGYFFGSYKPQAFGKVFAVVAGSFEDAIELEFSTSNGYSLLKLPILLVLSISDLDLKDEDCGCHGSNPPIGDSTEIALNPETYAQDLGGGCVNFTTPDRTVEEHLFYTAVRTTDQGIKGLTFNSRNISEVVEALRESSKVLCNHVEKFVEWKDDLKVIEQDQLPTDTDVQVADEAQPSTPATQPDHVSGNAAPTGSSSRRAENITIEAVTRAAPEFVMPAASPGGSTVGSVAESTIVTSPVNVFNAQPNLHVQMATALSPFVTEQLLYPLEPATLSSQFGGAVVVQGLVGLDQLKRKKSRLSGRVNNIRKAKKDLVDKIDKKLELEIVHWAYGDVLECRDSFRKIDDLIGQIIDVTSEYRSMLTAHGNAFLSTDINFINGFGATENKLVAQAEISKRYLKEIERTYAKTYPGRDHVSVHNPINWDDDLQLYHNTTIGHGHLLCFKQQWKSAGYSLGNVLHSLSLAPRQKKQIAVFDWDRSETGSRSEIQTNEERLSSHMNRDRGVSEIMNSAFKENIHASSSATTKSSSASVGASLGFSVGPVLVGVSGGYSQSKGSASSTASQSAARDFSANSMNQLSDTIQQSASSVRSQRSTVIQTVDQAESFGVTTEVIANYNICHAITIQHFEVLRHLVVEQNLVEAAECLFVPMDMSAFTTTKVLRWKHHLSEALFDSGLGAGFDALERITSNYVGSRFENIEDRYADESIENFSGDLHLTFEFERPYIREIEDGGDVEVYETYRNEIYRNAFFWASHRLVTKIMTRFVRHTEEEKDAIFEKEYAPELAREFIDSLQIVGESPNGTELGLNLDITMVGRYRKGRSVYVKLHSNGDPNIRRSDIERIRIKSPTSVEGLSRIILQSFRLNYQNEHQFGTIIRQRSIQNDIVNEDAAVFYTPLNRQEKTRPRDEDTKLADRLLDHLNEYLEYYHKRIWMNMDPCRFFGLLDGFIAPNSNGRSVASVVENRVIGAVSNNIILKVSPGYNLDPTYKVSEGVSLLDFYQPLTPADPFRISLPTRGTYAESVMGACNSCEHIDESRFWRINEVPFDSEPTSIQPISTDSRRADPGNLQAKAMESPVINIQNAPAAPDPTELGAAIDLMGKSGIFENMTGLDANQANALAALQSAAQSTESVIQVSKDMAKLAAVHDANRNNRKDLNEIDRLESENKITPEEAKEYRKDVLKRKDNATQSDTGSSTASGLDSGTTATQPSQSGQTIDSSVEAIGQGAKTVKVKETRPDGSSTEVEMERDENAPMLSPADEDLSPSRDDYSILTSFYDDPKKSEQFSAEHMFRVRKNILKTGEILQFVSAFQENVIDKNLTDEQKNRVINKHAEIASDNMFRIDGDDIIHIQTKIKRGEAGKLENIEGNYVSVDDAKVVDYFVFIHNFAKRHHDSEFFLPWHREFLLEFETNLGVSLPYWNWYSSPKVPTELNQVSLKSNSPYYNYLVRTSTDASSSRSWVSRLNTYWENLMNRFENPTGSNWFPVFSKTWEFPFHDLVHVDIGGKMGDILRSPFDPLFWMHHCFVDKLWADIHELISEDEAQNFYPAQNDDSNDLNMNNMSWPYVRSFHDTIDTTNYSYIYDGGFKKQTK